MAQDEIFARILRPGFQRASAPATDDTALVRMDARTAGFTAENDPQLVEWMGMSPAGAAWDGWYVLVAVERPNLYLSQVDRHEKLVEIGRVIGKGAGQKPLSFAQAVEYLAVWEYRSGDVGGLCAA